MIDETREQSTVQVDVPACLAPTLAGYRWARNRVGMAGAAVYRLHGRAGAPDLYLKHGVQAAAGDLIDEMVKLRWLAAYVPVPEVLHFVATADAAWLLMTALPGRTAYELLEADGDGRGAVVDALADFLHRLHAVPTGRCPFNADRSVRLALARDRIAAGLVDVDDFDAERAGWTAEQVWDHLVGLPPFPTDAVVTHGDFSLENLLIVDGVVTGCIDVGRAGLADRYQDLAILWNSLEEFGPVLQQRLFVRYGIDAPDMAKLAFHTVLDELF